MTWLVAARQMIFAQERRGLGELVRWFASV